MIIRISPSDPTSNLPADNEEAKALWQQQTSRFRLIQMFSRMQQMQCRPAIRNFVAVGQSSTTRRVREYGMDQVAGQDLWRCDPMEFLGWKEQHNLYGRCRGLSARAV